MAQTLLNGSRPALAINMKRLNLLSVAALALAPLSVSAAISYDQNVNVGGPASINGNDPGVYYGSGNHNGGFTVDREGQLELGLRAHTRYPSPDDVGITAPTGVYAFNDSTPGISPSDRASWNYDFSINTGTAGLANYSFLISLDKDPSAGQDFYTFPPLLIPDNGPALSTTIAMNSENYGFLFVGPGIPPYNQNIPGSYDIKLSAYDLQGQLVGETAIRVDVNGGTAAPDAGSTSALLGTALAGLALVRRKLAD